MNLLRVPEVAARLSLSQGTVRGLIARRAIEVVRVGRAVRIAETELDRLITKSIVPAIRDGRLNKGSRD